MSLSSLSEKSSFESLRFEGPPPLAPAVTGHMVWQGDELNPDEYVVQLNMYEVEMVRAAVISFKREFQTIVLCGPERKADEHCCQSVLNKPRSMINQKTFPLPRELASKLVGLCYQIHSGCGVVVLRGLDAARFNDEESVIAFAGVSSYVCSERATDAYANQTLSKPPQILGHMILADTLRSCTRCYP